MTEKCATCENVVNYSPYVYKAFITSVFDGDSCTAKLDLGMRVSMDIKIRLYGINAPEMRGGEKGNGVRSREYLRNLILGKDVIIKTYKDKTEKYGRWLAEIFVDNQSVNNIMVEDGYAVRYEE
jgi:micrococcal nuclease